MRARRRRGAGAGERASLRAVVQSRTRGCCEPACRQGPWSMHAGDGCRLVEIATLPYEFY